MLTRGYEVS